MYHISNFLFDIGKMLPHWADNYNLTKVELGLRRQLVGNTIQKYLLVMSDITIWNNILVIWMITNL